MAIIFCFCLFGASSKECGKIIKEKNPAEPSVKKTTSQQMPEAGGNDQNEFSLINIIFFQTT